MRGRKEWYERDIVKKKTDEYNKSKLGDKKDRS